MGSVPRCATHKILHPNMHLKQKIFGLESYVPARWSQVERPLQIVAHKREFHVDNIVSKKNTSRLRTLSIVTLKDIEFNLEQ